jgi:cobalamin biosynthesis Mg chelatase CobN
MSALPIARHMPSPSAVLPAALMALSAALALQPAAAGAATATNPASSTLAPVSPKARSGVGSGATSTRGPNLLGGGSAATGQRANAPGSTGAVGGTAGGAAAGGGTPTTTYAPPAGSGLGTAVPQAQRPGTLTPATSAARAQRKSSSSVSGAAIALAVLAALVALACVAWAIARWQAYEPRWIVSLRHSMAEAGFRASATWAEFTDWVRLGR